MTRNTRHFEIPAETGRTEVDREVIARTLIGLMNNANVGGIVLLAVKSGAGSAYKNMCAERFEEEARKTGKPLRIVYLTNVGGSSSAAPPMPPQALPAILVSALLLIS